MTAVFFVYGLAFFCLGLAVALESRRTSDLPLGRQLPWLAAFGFAHSLVEWADMFLLLNPTGLPHDVLTLARTLLLPLSAVLLVRFGIGLVGEAGPLPVWMTFLPVVLLVPIALLVGYAVVVAFTQSSVEKAADVWSRYLLYLPGNLLAGFGFVRQARVLWHDASAPLSTSLDVARRLLLGAALAFALNAVVAGLIVPAAPYGLAPWLNYDTVQSITGVPVQIWRMVSAVAVTIFVVRALDVFEAERAQRLAALDKARAQAQHAALQAQSEARQIAEGWTNGLVSISRRIANLENVDTILSAIVTLSQRLLESDTAALALWDETGTRLVMKCHATVDKTQAPPCPEVCSPLIVEPLRAGRAACLSEHGQDGESRWRCPAADQEIQTTAIVPLQLDGRPVGGLWAGRFTPEPFTTADLIGLERLADQAVIAIEHALMAARLQSLAVTEERGRIAREMHDGLAQVLGFLSLETQTLEVLVRQGNCEAALAELEQARKRINEAQANVRENILSLRTTLAGEVGLMPALRQYVEEFGVQTGIDARLVSEVEEALPLSPIAETQLVRIVQEALANVRKHAQAHHAQVRLAARSGCLCVTVADDGIGFDGQAVRSHFGLQTMRERAQSVGGGLTIASQPGEGTQVELWLPLLPQRN